MGRAIIILMGLCLGLQASAQKGNGLVLELCHADSFLRGEVQLKLQGRDTEITASMGAGRSVIRLHNLDTGIYLLHTGTEKLGLYERKLKVYEAYYAKSFINLYETDSSQITQLSDRKQFLNQFGTCNARRNLHLHVTNAEREGLMDITVQLLETDTLVYGTFTTYQGTAFINSPPEEDYRVLLSHVSMLPIRSKVNVTSGSDDMYCSIDVGSTTVFLDAVTIDVHINSVPFFDPYGQERARRDILYREIPQVPLRRR